MKLNWRENFNEWQEKYDALSHREKQMVFWGAIAVAFAIYYLFVASFFSMVEAKHEALQKSQRLYLYVDANAKQIEELKKTTRDREFLNNSAKALTVVQQQLELARLNKAVNYLQQSGDNTIQLRLSNAAFNQLVDYLFQLSSQYRFSVKQFKITATKKTGEVNADLQLMWE